MAAAEHTEVLDAIVLGAGFGGTCAAAHHMIQAGRLPWFMPYFMSPHGLHKAGRDL